MIILYKPVTEDCISLFLFEVFFSVESPTKNVHAALVNSLHHHRQEYAGPPTHLLSLTLLMLSVCVPQGPPSVSFAVHEAAVHPLVLGPRWGHWCNGFGGSGQAPQKPAL